VRLTHRHQSLKTMSFQLVRNFGAPRRFSASAGSRPTLVVRGRRGPVAMRAVTLRGLPVKPHAPNAVAIDVAPGINTLRILLDPAIPGEVVELCEQGADGFQVLHSHIYNPADPVSGYRIFGEEGEK
jgi:hypothetical protein